jgi:DNA-binding protein Fis
MLIIDVSKAIKEADQREITLGAYQAIKNKVEPVFLIELLKYAGNNKQHASRIAGLSVTTINRKLKQHGLVVTKLVCGGGE